jgi:dienelactone hydrolase
VRKLLTNSPSILAAETSDASLASNGDWTIQSINGMQYMVLLPDHYDPSVKYATTLYLHQLDMGSGGPQLLQDQINPWFNTPEFRATHPTIIVAPLLDQNADLSGQTINFGGVTAANTAGEANAIAALRQVMDQYSVDPARVYVTGNSMGGIGTEDMLIKFNAYTGTEGTIFAAGLALAGADYGQGYPQPNQSVITGLKDVPFWAIHGGGDTQVPLAFDQNLYAAEKAIGGLMKYTEDASLGHDVWDTYYPKIGADSPLSWLYSQTLPTDTWGPAAGTVTSPAPDSGDTPTQPEVTPDELSITLSGDAYQGSPQFIVTIDSQILTAAPTTVTAAHGTDAQSFNFLGHWGSSSHNVEIGFVNDLYDGAGDTDRNLYVEQVSYNGHSAMSQVQPLFWEGSIQLGVS